ncbi:unnamed protein product [Chondrus crispus]|uniref:HTH myb-type domain-containing protein n=1 Tax=Chondrus crispus TaxID=2769 RepID=R7QN93_CHOCR|nr:unnamed protein product [Chondrus crispus]CDF39554.1 unnamed protein product [Chondrus crispus]|eukprot:XP_005709848.1 unnamed protein product [Chondrus crispus]
MNGLVERDQSCFASPAFKDLISSSIQLPAPPSPPPGSSPFVKSSPLRPLIPLDYICTPLRLPCLSITSRLRSALPAAVTARIHCHTHTPTCPPTPPADSTISLHTHLFTPLACCLPLCYTRRVDILAEDSSAGRGTDMQHERRDEPQRTPAQQMASSSRSRPRHLPVHSSSVITTNQTSTQHSPDPNIPTHSTRTSTALPLNPPPYVHPDAHNLHAPLHYHPSLPPRHDAHLHASANTHQRPLYEPPTRHQHMLRSQHYASHYPPAIVHPFQAPRYPAHPNPHEYPTQQGQVPQPYFTYYPVEGAKHPTQGAIGPAIPQQAPPHAPAHHDAVVYNPHTPPTNPTMYVALPDRPYYVHQAPDPNASRRSVIQRSYYNPGTAQTVVFARREINRHSPRSPREDISSTSLSGLAAPQVVQPIVQTHGNTTQHVTPHDAMPPPQISAQGTSPVLRGVRACANHTLVSPVIQNSMRNPAYQQCVPNIGQGFHVQSLPPMPAVSPTPAHGFQHVNTPVVVPTLPATHIPQLPTTLIPQLPTTLIPQLPTTLIPQLSPSSSYPQYAERPHPGTKKIYGNAVGFQNVYAQPATVHYITPPPAPKKKRLQWTPELHAKFEDAVNEIGLEAAVPKTLLQAINEPTLTRENVASHLQKFREMIRKRKLEEQKQSVSGPSRKRRLIDGSPHKSPETRKNAGISSSCAASNMDMHEGSNTGGESSQEGGTVPYSRQELPIHQREKQGAPPDLHGFQGSGHRDGTAAHTLQGTTDLMKAQTSKRKLPKRLQPADCGRGSEGGESKKPVAVSAATEETLIPIGDWDSLTGHQEISNVKSRTRRGTVPYSLVKDQHGSIAKRNTQWQKEASVSLAMLSSTCHMTSCQSLNRAGMGKSVEDLLFPCRWRIPLDSLDMSVLYQPKLQRRTVPYWRAVR